MEKKQLIDTINDAIWFALANLHTATIARVESVNAKTVDVRPVINRVVDGESIQLPVFSKVPPVFMQGGGSYTAYPIAVGDYCLLIFTERCFDRWYGGADFQNPAEFRMHDYSDGLAIFGANPQASAITIPDVITQIGDTYQEGNYEHVGDRDQTGNYTLEGDIDQTGDYTVTGDVDITGNRTQTGNDVVTGSGSWTATISAAGFSGVGGGIASASNGIDATLYKVGGVAGVSGSFTTADAKTVTVTNGIITSIV